MKKLLYKYRFELFLFSQLAILFGSLIVPQTIFENILDPILFLINLLAGIILISKRPRLVWFCVFVLGLSAILFIISTLIGEKNETLDFLRLAGYFLFYLVVTFEIIKQVWLVKKVNKNVIYGLMSGFISLGLIGFFIFMTIEMVYHNSFQGPPMLALAEQPELITEKLMYFSFITLMTIGYGDIIPVTGLAQKAVILVGLIGNFYLVIITAVVVEKYITHSK
ncbi:ion channel [Croceitalea vernalis]|uniref:Ion channel n=1 Tax=Croceitalea vernalis TaxID=3075599 RepID=A0ABU3BHW2_9FLAO|nr:ion channel [Croceitalea sp. P007]MDT0621734.1 ion channel [Croceitalea sp. P007]